MKTPQHSIARPTIGRAVLVTATLLAALAMLVVARATAAAGSVAKVGVVKTAIGTVLATGQGRTLYMFAADKHGQSACYGQCAHYWPPLLTSGKPTAVKGAKASLLGTTRRRDGKLQVTYNGRPVYRYVSDTQSGQIGGQGLNLSGGLWWAISPNGALDKQKASMGGGGGYG
jgi:predicted lipoprotein with Yx(FWY)xxD motif